MAMTINHPKARALFMHIKQALALPDGIMGMELRMHADELVAVKLTFAPDVTDIPWEIDPDKK